MIRSFPIFAAGWLVFSLAGCGASPPPAERTEASVEDRLVALGLSYIRVGRDAKDEIAFRAALEKMDRSDMERLQVRSLDDLLTSPRDKSPFAIRYGVKPGTPGVSKDILAYEQFGKDGKHFVVYSSLETAELSEPELKAAIPPDGSP